MRLGGSLASRPQLGGVLRRAVAVAATWCAITPAVRAERPPAPPSPAQTCQHAIGSAEREHRLPAGLLHAIAQVEAGRPDTAGRGTVAWPWTINAEGQGRFFETKQAAIAAVEALRARGVRLIDVGCLQVNLHHHPQAFPDLDTAFDPLANARYAALFLTRLQAQSRNWEQAAANYHSQTPERGEAYRQKVMAAWPAMAVRLAEEQRREALAVAWAAGRGAPARTAQGWQTLAIPMPGGQARQLIVMGTPVLRQAEARPTAARRLPPLELAEAPPTTAGRRNR